MDKIYDEKTADNLAILIASKVGPDDNVDAVAKKVIADYWTARRMIRAPEEISD